MTCNILVYGATGFSGQLIAAEGKSRGMSKGEATGAFRMILAARDGQKLREVAEKNGMPFRAFPLNDLDEVKKQLDGINVVINAAGPFAFTAEILAKAALGASCHYVDISGEIEVYRKLDDFARAAVQRGIAIVSSAGHLAATSDILLELALQALKRNGLAVAGGELGAVRIAMSSMTNSSRGSALTLARSFREQVTVIRKGRPIEQGQESAATPGSAAMGNAPPKEQMMIWHEPVGRLERSFDFGRLPDDKRKDGGVRIASAVNLVDTLTARYTVIRHGLLAGTIQSYAETETIKRVAYQLSGVFASLGTLPWVRTVVKEQMKLLPEAPAPEALRQDGNVVVLEIEDIYRRRLIDWRLETPNVYQVTAQLVVAVACRVAEGARKGWVTPADALNFTLPDTVDELDFNTPSSSTSLRSFSVGYLEAALRNIAIERRVV